MQPNKSRAFIITFVVVLVLLIAGYFLFFSPNAVLKSGSLVGKKFSPLLGTPKEKELVVDDKPQQPDDTQIPDDTQTPDDTQIPDDTTTPPIKNPPQVPTYTPPKATPKSSKFPSPEGGLDENDPQKRALAQCEDGRDNDGDKLVDSADPGCHTDGNNKNLQSYTPRANNERDYAGIPEITIEPDLKKQISCDIEDVPLVFTEAEQARLDELTRQFYRLAPQLKTEEDIILEISSNQGYQDIIDNAKTLTAQCWEQTSTPQYLRNSINIEQIGENEGNKVFTKSTINKGRTERLPTPYYNKTSLSHSFYEAYYVDSATGLPVYSWEDWEKIRNIW